MTIALGVLASLLLILLALELGLRWADGIPVFRLKNFVREQVDLLKVNTYVDYHPLLGWVMSPNVRAGGGPSTFTTDEHGTRLPSPQPRALSTGAILASGDSFTIGSEVTDSESWPAILEAMTGTPVINAASGGWGADQIVLRAEQLLDVARPSTVIISFLSSDIERAEYRIYGGAHKPYYTVKHGELELHNHPVPRFKGNRDEVGWARANFGWSYLVLCAAKELRFAKWTNSWDLQYRLATSDGVEICCKLLARLKAAADVRKFRLILVMQYGSNDFNVNSGGTQRIEAGSFSAQTLQAHPFVYSFDLSVARGHVVYGPYVKLLAGSYKATFWFSVDQFGPQPLRSAIGFEVVADRTVQEVIQLGEAERATLLSGSVSISFTNDAMERAYEFRIDVQQAPLVGTFRFFGVSLERFAHGLTGKVVDYARARGIDTVDPWADMKRIFDKDREQFLRLWVLQPDGKTLGHMSAEGNRFIAEQIAATLRREPLHCPTTAPESSGEVRADAAN